MLVRRLAVGAALTVLAAAVFTQNAAAASLVPRPDHIVLVMFENKNYSTINGSSS